jgi:hypothetical protein
VRAKKEKKLPDFYIWLFIVCIKKYRRMIFFKLLYFNSQIWLNLPGDANYFLYIFPPMIATLGFFLIPKKALLPRG